MEFTAKLRFHRIPDFFVADMNTKDMELFSHEILLTFEDMDIRTLNIISNYSISE